MSVEQPKPATGTEDTEWSQQREVLSRLAETDANAKLIKPFEEADLNRMIRGFSHAQRKTLSRRDVRQ